MASTHMDENVYAKVPRAAKTHWVGFLAMFAGMWTTLGAIGVGVGLGNQITPWKGALALFLGYLICLGYGFLVGEVGRREGLPTAVLCERPFSTYGKIVPVLLAFAIAGAFIGVQADAVARISMSILGYEAPTGFDPMRGFLAATLCAVMMVSSYLGIKYIKIVSWYALPIFGTLLVVTCYLVVSDHPGGLTDIMTTEADAIPFMDVVFLGVSLFAGFAAFMPDISRFLATRGGLAKALCIGFPLAALVPIWGIVVGAARGDQNYFHVFSNFGLAFSLYAIFALFLVQWTTNDANGFTSGIALSTIFTTLHQRFEAVPRLTRSQATLVPALLGVVTAFAGTGSANGILTFVNALGAWLIPLAGVLIAHFYIIERRGPVSTHGLAGLLSLIGVGTLTQLEYVPLAAVTSLLLAIVAYVVLYYCVEAPLLGQHLAQEQTRSGTA